MTLATATPTVTATVDIHASPELVYTYLTNRDDLCDWLCYDGMVRLAEGGHALFTWYEDNSHAYGVYQKIEENKHLNLTWQDGSDMGSTEVDIQLEADGDSTHLHLTHSGFATEAAHDKYANFWTYRLRNLKSVIETGANITISERVIVGITPQALNENLIEEHGFPVSEGVFVLAALDGFSAAEAGIQANDLLVEVNGTAITQLNSIATSLHGKKPGDQVEVAYYRGAEKHTATVELRGYPIPDIPADFADYEATLAARLEKRLADLTSVLASVSEKEADHKINDGEYSIREMLAHIIITQRHQHEWLSTYVEGPRRINPFYRVAGRIAAVIETYPTLESLLGELQRLYTETLAIVRQMPAEHNQRKNYLWWIAFETEMAAYAPFFFDQNVEHMRRTLADARA